MSVAEIFRLATAHGLVLTLKDGALFVKSATGAAVPVEVRETIREHRAAIVAHLLFAEHALDLLTASQCRMADAYRLGVTLDTDEGRRLDAAINAAFWSDDADGLTAAVAAYEAFALARFTDGCEGSKA